jgi:hypothetical protein
MSRWVEHKPAGEENETGAIATAMISTINITRAIAGIAPRFRMSVSIFMVTVLE